MYKIRLVLIFLLAVIIMAPVQALMVADMDDLFPCGGSPPCPNPIWGDDRDNAAQGTGWLSQGIDPEDASNSVMKIDYGVTYDGLGVGDFNTPDPCSGWNYLGAFVGVGQPGGAFGATGDPCDPNGAYLGDFDRVPATSFPPGFIPDLSYDVNGLSNYYFTLDVYKPLRGHSEHVRALQLYDSNGDRSTYCVQREGERDRRGLYSPGQVIGRTIMDTPTGWTRHIIPITPANIDEIDVADLSDIEDIKIWVSSWSVHSDVNDNPYDVHAEPNEYAKWPHASQGDWETPIPYSGLPILIDNLQLFQICDRIIEGDVNHDCKVDWLDFVLVSDDWLEVE